MSKKPKGENHPVLAVIEGEDDSDDSIDHLTTPKRGADLEKELKQNIATLQRPPDAEQKESVIPESNILHTSEEPYKNAMETSSTAALFMRLATLEGLAGAAPKGFFNGIANVFRRNKKTSDDERTPPPRKSCTVDIRSTRLYTPPVVSGSRETNIGAFIATTKPVGQSEVLCDLIKGKSYERWRTLLAETHSKALSQAVRTAEKLDGTIEPKASLIQEAHRDINETIYLSNTLSDAIKCFGSTAIQCYPALKRRNI